MKIVTLGVDTRAKEGKRGGEVSTCAFASTIFARPKKTPALQASSLVYFYFQAKDS